MDNITHSLTGLFLSRAGINRWCELASPLLLVSANVPDADIVMLLAGPLSYFHYHRHLTHSLVAAPVLSLLVALVFRAFRPGLPLFRAFLVALLGVASHLLLDLTNVYGVRLLLPFHTVWLRWDLTPVIDFFIWTAFALALALPFVGRLIGSEMGERRPRSSGAGLACAALMFLCAYDGARAFAHTRVLAMLNAREYEGAIPLQTAAFPESMNPLRWRGMVETASRYLLYDVVLPGEFHPTQPEVVEKAAPSPAIRAAAQTAAFRVLAGFARYPVYRETIAGSSEGGARVELSDVRFPGFISVADVGPRGEVRSSRFSFGQSRPR